VIDAHIHLDQYPNIENEISKWIEAGITGVVAVSTDLRSSYQTLELKRKFPDFVFAAIGFHPEQPLPNPSDWVEWINLLKQERHLLSAIGEVGLPYYTLEHSLRVFSQYIELLEQITYLASEYHLPLALHAVYEHAEIALKILQKYNIRLAHFHWLKASLPVVDAIIKSGYFISVTPEVCYRERDKALLTRVPLQQLLLETDGPWPFSGPFSNNQTSPLLLFESVKCVAKLYGNDISSMKNAIIDNTRKIYGYELHEFVKN
jgi:TatD DNase family protein